MPKRQQKKSVTVSTGGKEEQQSVTVKKRMRKQRFDEVEERSEKDLFVRVSIPTNDAMGDDQEEEEEDELLVDVEHVDEPPDEAGSYKKLEIPGKSRREKEKNAFVLLSELLPLSPAIRDQLDKTGILRVCIAFLQMHILISDIMGLKSKSNVRLSSPAWEQRTSEEHREARKLQREWAKQKQGKVEQLLQFAFNLFQAMDGFAIVLNHLGRVIYVSETVAVHLRLSQIELIGNALGEFLHPADDILLREKLAIFVESRALRVLGPELRFVLRFRCAPGRKPMMPAAVGSNWGMPGFKAIHFTGNLWPDNQGRFIGFGQPLVAYGLNELRLAPSAFMFRATPSLELIFVDNTFVSFAGFQPDLLLDHSFYAFVHTADVERVVEMHQTTLDQGQAQSGFFRFISATGGYFWMQCRLCMISTNRLSCTSSPVKMLIGVCTPVSVVEEDHLIMDTVQKELLDGASLKEDRGKCEDSDQQNNGLLGFYSNKFYNSELATDG